MKKLISCLLVVMILLTAVSAFADNVEQNNVLTKFVEETNKETQDVALQLQSGDNVSDLVIRGDGTTVHFVARDNGKEIAHVQVNPTGLLRKRRGSRNIRGKNRSGGSEYENECQKAWHDRHSEFFHRGIIQ